LPVYLLTVIKPPKQIIKAFNKVRQRFLWAGNQQLHGRKCKVSWEKLQRPINRGERGITDLAAFSRALRLRWLWFQWKYTDRVWVGMELLVDELDLELFATTIKVIVNNGKMASFWFSNWLDGGRLPFNSQSCLITARGKGDRWQKLWPMINELGMSCMTLHVPLLDEFVEL
jgi:hypothetical protein